MPKTPYHHCHHRNRLIPTAAAASSLFHILLFSLLFHYFVFVVAVAIPSYIQNYKDNILDVPLRDHDNYYYFVIKSNTPLITLHTKYKMLGRVGELDDYYLIATEKDNDLHLHKRHLEESFEWFDQQTLKRLHKRVYKPTESDILECKKELEKRGSPPRMDPIFMEYKDPEFSKQWHLNNMETPGNDINVKGAWKSNATGEGVAVCFIDDGLDYTHADLKDNFYGNGSYDFNDHGDLPTPKLWDDRHGTRCAGEVAAISNTVCGVGIAQKAKVSGVRILSGELTESDEAVAINYDFHNNHIYSCSWGPSDNGQAMDAPPKIVAEAFTKGIVEGRSGLGSLFVFATGNGGGYGDNCNFDGYTNSIFTITVGAIDKYNNHPRYSEECSAQMVVTYSSGNGGYIHTSDWARGITDGCTDHHGGTSAAAPLASGIYALVMGERPDFSWRDFQHVSVQSALPVSLQDKDWMTVANNRKYNHKFGFGKLDASAIVDVARSHQLVRNQTKIAPRMVIIEKDIPQGKIGLKSTIEITREDVAKAKLGRLEHVTVTVTIKHDRRGEVQCELTSPNDYVSTLATARHYDASKKGFQNWTFMSVKHWEEDPVGNWTLHVFDTDAPTNKGRFLNWYLTLFGELAGEGDETPSTVPISTPSGSNGNQTSTGAPGDDGQVHEIVGGAGTLLFFAFVGFAGVIALGIFVYRKRSQRDPRDMYTFEELDDEKMLGSTFGDDDEDYEYDNDRVLFSDEVEDEEVIQLTPLENKNTSDEIFTSE